VRPYLPCLQTQRSTQPSSPSHLRPQEQPPTLVDTRNIPTRSGPPTSSAATASAAPIIPAPVYAPSSQLGAAAPPVGLGANRVLATAARLGDPTPVASAPPQSAAQLHTELRHLQQQLATAEGTNKLLRSNLSAAEKERLGLRQRLAALEGRGAAIGANQFTVNEIQKQVDVLKQQLAFKEQEVDDLKRQQADRWERLKAAEAEVRRAATQQPISPVIHAGGCVSWCCVNGT
jgi:hypothetical protein